MTPHGYHSSYVFRAFIVGAALLATVSSGRAQMVFTVWLDGRHAYPPNTSPGTGYGTVVLDAAETSVTVSIEFSGLSGAPTAAHIHIGPPGSYGPALLPLQIDAARLTGVYPFPPTYLDDLKRGLLSINVHTRAYPDGEIQGQLLPKAPDFGPTAGDLNADSRADVGDAVRLLQILAGQLGMTREQAAEADFNGDGRDDLSDVRSLLASLVGLESLPSAAERRRSEPCRDGPPLYGTRSAGTTEHLRWAHESPCNRGITTGGTR